MMKRCMNCMEEYEETQPCCPNCGWTDEDSCGGEGLEPGTILQGRYIIGTDRGYTRADMAYIGWDALFARKVMVMEYCPESCVDREADGIISVREDSEKLFREGMERFCENAETLIQMDDTRGLLNVFASFQENNTAYMIWEYPGERSLRDFLTEQGLYSLEQTERLVTKVSAPLLVAHRRDMCHGQLSLDSCYVRQDGSIAVGMFNDAGFITGDWNGSDMDKAGANADIFELAYIAGAALAGVEHWETRGIAECLDEMEERLPEYVINVLDDAMSRDPEKTPKNLRRFVDQLMDEATIEMPSNRVYKEDNLKRNSPLWNLLHR